MPKTTKVGPYILFVKEKLRSHGFADLNFRSIQDGIERYAVDWERMTPTDKEIYRIRAQNVNRATENKSVEAKKAVAKKLAIGEGVYNLPGHQIQTSKKKKKGKKHKDEAFVNRYRKIVDDEEMEQKRKRDRGDLMNRYGPDTAPGIQWGKVAAIRIKEKALKEKVLLIDANYSYQETTGDRDYIPSEIAVAQFSPRQGITAHKNFLVPPLPPVENSTEMEEAEARARDTNLEFDEIDVSFEDDYEEPDKIYESVIEMMEECEYRVLCRTSRYNFVASALEYLDIHFYAKNSAFPSQEPVRIICVEDYVSVLWEIHGDAALFPLPPPANITGRLDLVTCHTNDYVQTTMCDLHLKHRNPVCALTAVNCIQWGVLKLLYKPLKIRISPDPEWGQNRVYVPAGQLGMWNDIDLGLPPLVETEEEGPTGIAARQPPAPLPVREASVPLLVDIGDNEIKSEEITLEELEEELELALVDMTDDGELSAAAVVQRERTRHRTQDIYGPRQLSTYQQPTLEAQPTNQPRLEELKYTNQRRNPLEALFPNQQMLEATHLTYERRTVLEDSRTMTHKASALQRKGLEMVAPSTAGAGETRKKPKKPNFLPPMRSLHNIGPGSGLDLSRPPSGIGRGYFPPSLNPTPSRGEC